MRRDPRVKWLFQGALPGAVISVPLFGVYSYYGLIVLLALIGVAVFSKNLAFKLRLWGFLAGSAAGFLSTWAFLILRGTLS